MALLVLVPPEDLIIQNTAQRKMQGRPRGRSKGWPRLF